MPHNPDPKAPEGRVQIDDFPGLVTNTDPHDLPPGAAVEQVNCHTPRLGELRPRLGSKPVKFDL